MRAVIALLFALTLPLGSVAQAQMPERPTAQEVKRWNAAQYNDYLVAVDNAALGQVVQRMGELQGVSDAAAYEQFLEQLKAVLHEARVQCGLMPPYRGDTGLRDAALAGYDLALEMADEDMTELAQIVFAERVRSEDLARLEELNKGMDAKSEAIVTQLQEAQEAYAAKHRLRMVDNEEADVLASEIEAMEATHFVVEGLPPEGSVLPAETHIDFAMRYHNQLIDQQNIMVDHWNELMEATGGDAGTLAVKHARIQEALRAEVAKAEQEGDWLGDASLKEANITLGKGLVALGDGEVAEYVALSGKSRLKGKDRKRLDELSDVINERTPALITESGAPYTAYAAAWHFAAYEAWAEVQGLYGQ